MPWSPAVQPILFFLIALIVSGPLQFLGLPTSASAENVGTSEGSALPRFKWGQIRETLFVTIAVKGLEKGSVTISFLEDRLSFHGLDSSGRAFDLDLELAQDIDGKSCKWEHLQRPDRWGDAILASLPKKFPGRWETLLVDSGPYRKVMDRDWNREDQLEPLEEDPYLSEHRKYAPILIERGMKQAREGVEAVIVNVRCKECDNCRLADETFAKAAKRLADSKLKLPWQSKVRMRIVDPRSERRVARMLGASCASSPQECRHFVLAYGGKDEPARIRARHDPDALMADIEILALEQFRPISENDLRARPNNASRALLVLGPDASGEAHSAAHRLRMQLDIRLSESIASGVTIWSPGESTPDIYDDHPGLLEAWVRARAVAPLANTSEFEQDEPYEELGLPVARLFYDGNQADAAARATVHDLALEFVGRVAFFARNATLKAHEWRHHGLPPGRFPSFGAARSMAHNATRYAFLKMPTILVNSTSATTDVDFWSGPARGLLRTFLEDILAQKHEASLPSESPPEEEFAWGIVKKLVGRTCRSIVESSENETLIEVFDEWRRDHPNRTRYLDALAPILARRNITTFRLDFGYNECPSDAQIPIISAGYSGYYLVPRMSKQRKRHPAKMKKLDPSFVAVLKFLSKHSEMNLTDSIQTVQHELEASIQQLEQEERSQVLWEHWILGDGRNHIGAAVVGLAGVLLFFKLRRGKVPKEFGPAPPPDEKSDQSPPGQGEVS